nr:hypothetical protein [Bradyrhizobium sp. CSA112]
MARAANYRNAGTVEFIFDGGEFYFLGMNTRLQVEHTVTEMITGIDLVAQQIYVAAGRELGFSQSNEARLYAEAPERGYVPTTGKVLVLEYPDGDGARIDSGILQGQQITTAFDPMLAKIIAHSPTRIEAALKAHRAMRELVLLGCETNANFLTRILRDEAFLSGHVHTGYLEENPHIASAEPASDLSAFLATAALLTRLSANGQMPCPSFTQRWAAGETDVKHYFEVDGVDYQLSLSRCQQGYRLLLSNKVIGPIVFSQ